ncbi:MAG: DUF4432 family protein [Anaerolineae bacterium]|nr:DUF4432 family protein [Anaerolineae bacterium]
MTAVDGGGRTNVFETTIHLDKAFFGLREKTLIESSPLSASTFLFDSGVCGVRLHSDVGELVLLPFQGQQVWSAAFGERNLTMQSMCDMPRAGVPFLETFGGFAQHCGVLAVGGPGPTDTHPLHGELPNAPYQQAWVVVGENEKGSYIGLGGQYRHTVAFSTNYIAEPLVRLYAGSTLFDLSMTVTNLKNTPMELLYLTHVNFLPVDGGRLVYSAQPTPEHVRVRASIPSHIKPAPGYAEFLAELRGHPEKHHLLSPALLADPETVFFIDYLADESGWAHAMQVHPDGAAVPGGADYIAHRPVQLPKATRWISRTPDQQAIALTEPGTAEPEGYTVEKAKGNVHTLPPHGQFHCDIMAGALDAEQAAQIETRIKQIVA